MRVIRRIEYKWIVAAAFVFGIFMDIMDMTVINVALPTLARDFHASTDTLEWVVTGYLLSLAVWIPASGWIGDHFGTKKTFMFALAMFIGSSALCGAAWDINSLVAFRVLQGVGGGMMTPVGTAMLFRAFPPHERAQASAVLFTPTILAPTLGPLLGGWLVTSVSWRLIFYINLPIGLLGFLFTMFFVREHTEPAAGRFDPWGFVLSGGALIALLYALSRGPVDGWSSPQVIVPGTIGLAALAAMVVLELKLDEPMLKLRLLKNRMFRTGNLAMFTSTGGLMGLLFLLPLYLQQLRGLSAFQSGLATFPGAIGMVLMMQVTSRIYGRVGPRRMMVFGLTGALVTTLAFLEFGLHTHLVWVDLLMLLRGGFMAFAMMPLQAATFASISPQDVGRASSLFSTNRQVASSVGVALLATVFIQRTRDHVAALGAGAGDALRQHAGLLAFHDAFLVASLLCLVAIGFAFLVRDEDAAASMRPRVVGREAAPGTEEAVVAAAG